MNPCAALVVLTFNSDVQAKEERKLTYRKFLAQQEQARKKVTEHPVNRASRILFQSPPTLEGKRKRDWPDHENSGSFQANTHAAAADSIYGPDEDAPVEVGIRPSQPPL